VGLILWIDQNELATELIARVFKGKNKPFYTLNSAADFSYLIRDLNPELIVLDGETCVKSLSALRQQYEQTQGFYEKPVVLLGPRPELDFIKNLKGTLLRPIDPFELPELLSKM
jgi:hypothetical protein